MPNLRVLWFLALLLISEHAAATTTPSGNDRKSTEAFEPSWVPGPHNRGTLGLVFSCVITLSLCIWTTVHVNIEPEDELNETLERVLDVFFRHIKKGDWVNKKLKKFLAGKMVRKIGWSCIILIAPEGMMAIAVYERKAAYLLRKNINAIIKTVNPEIEKANPEIKTVNAKWPKIAACVRKAAYLLKKINAIIKTVDPEIETVNAKSPKVPQINKWDHSLAYYAIMGGFVIPEAVYDAAIKELPKAKEDNAAKPKGLSEAREDDAAKPKELSKAKEDDGGVEPNKHLTLTPHGVLRVVQWELEEGNGPKLLSAITAEEVHDKGNATTLTKGIVVWQALWIVVQVIGRTAAHYPVTLLELHTVLHTFCALYMYYIWWRKPLDIETSTTIPLSCEKEKELELVSCLVRETTAPDPTSPLTVKNPPGGKTNKSTSDQSPSTHHANPKSLDIEKASPLTAGEVITSGQDPMAGRAYPTFPDIEKASSPTINEANTSSQYRLANRPYLTSRSGLGKLMYQSLFDPPEGSKKEYCFQGIEMAYKRLSDAQENLGAQALIISFIGLIFGGVHLAAWNNRFPSYAEQLLWKISAAITAATWCSFTLSLYLYPALERLEKRNPFFETLVQWTFKVGFGVGPIPVLFARLYLLVESFASIRKVPRGSYEIPVWSNAWPHAS